MAISHLLDTNICIYIRRARPPAVKARFERMAPGSLAMSVITWGELLYGASHSTDPPTARAKLDRIAGLIPVLPLPTESARHYGDIRARLAQRGELIGPNDLWIAAHARAAGLTLVTNTAREFRRVKGLKVENWA
ncbi:MAG TPA: type II toxin-antitoxin system VapC family toxin [Rhodanobacteraceae bacterium]